MKKAFLFFAALFASAVCFSQTGKQVVVVEKFDYTTDFGTGDVSIIRNEVISSLQATGRVIVIDVENQADLAKEAIRRASEEAVSDNREVSDVGTMAANYILKGQLNSISSTKAQKLNSNKVPETYYECILNYTLTLVDPSNGSTISTYPYEIKDGGWASQYTGQTLRNKVINNASGKMKSFVEECFPVRGKILQVADGNATKAKTVYINLGSENGISSGQMFDVYEIVDIAGETSEKLIGALKAKEIMSGTRSLCTVSSGGDIIATKLADNKELTIKSRMKKSLFGL